MTCPLRCFVLIALVLPPSAATAQILRVEQMNAAHIAALDRQKTAVLLWGGILELVVAAPFARLATDAV